MEKINFPSLKPKNLKREFKIDGEIITIEGCQLDYFQSIEASSILEIDLDTNTKAVIKKKALDYISSKEAEEANEDFTPEEYTEEEDKLYAQYMKQWERVRVDYAVHILENYSNLEKEQIPYLFSKIDAYKVIELANDIARLGGLEDSEGK